MALVDLTDGEVVDFVKFLISKGANVNCSNLKGDSPLHLMATYTSKLNHLESKDPELVKKEEENLIAVIKVLLENGASLTAKNNEDKTPFSLALGRAKIQVVDLLSDNVKISESPTLLHDFKSFVFHVNYLEILYKLLNRDEANLLPGHFNSLDKLGFNVFLAYI